jgi:hypothetical protein
MPPPISMEQPLYPSQTYPPSASGKGVFHNALQLRWPAMNKLKITALCKFYAGVTLGSFSIIFLGACYVIKCLLWLFLVIIACGWLGLRVRGAL